MKTKRFGFFTILAAIVLMLGLLFAPGMQAQVVPTTYGNFAGTGVSNYYANATSYTINSTPIELRKDQGVAILPFVAGDAGATNLATFTWHVSADGSNWTTNSGITTAIALSASTNIVAPFVNFPITTINNVRYLRLGSLATAVSNKVTLVRMQWSRHE